MIDLWKVSGLAEAVAAVAYAYLAITTGANLHRGRQWRSNALGTATFAIFVAASLGRLVHAAHVMPVPWDDPGTTAAARTRMADPLHVFWSVATAAVATWFFSQRHNLQPLHASWLWSDMRRRHDEALKVQEEVLDHLLAARERMQSGQDAAARARIAQALAGARGIIGQTLQTGGRRSAGSLRILERTP